MTKLIVDIPEPKEDYDTSTQRQINRSIATLIQQLNTTYQQNVRDDAQQQTWFLG